MSLLLAKSTHPRAGLLRCKFRNREDNADGTSSVTDVLVGADGIHSATRGTMYKRLAFSIRDDKSRERLFDCIDPLVKRNLVPATKLLKEYPDVELLTSLTLHLGKDKHIVTYPVSQGRELNVVIFHHCDAFGGPFEGRWVTDISEKKFWTY
ncbi:hypothetical protein L210DRAFT_244435 [Boletus edulis BED1]|uniref:FAD-binding domain-containing protein n=1 Tax=Boletus edulis BED1 TaxID=1328754 RepID=A0AAD4GD65_BOLED|nr:hypothetical protein L210DRAFT_244435 [Boletus edulis BED1]